MGVGDEKHGKAGTGAVVVKYKGQDGGEGVASFIEPGIYEWTAPIRGVELEAEVLVIAAGELARGKTPGRAGSMTRCVLKTTSPVKVVVGSLENNMSSFGDVVAEGYEGDDKNNT